MDKVNEQGPTESINEYLLYPDQRAVHRTGQVPEGHRRQAAPQMVPVGAEPNQEDHVAAHSAQNRRRYPHCNLLIYYFDWD